MLKLLPCPCRCVQCEDDHMEDVMLLCELCRKGCHLGCHVHYCGVVMEEEPPKDVPWFCKVGRRLVQGWDGLRLQYYPIQRQLHTHTYLQECEAKVNDKQREREAIRARLNLRQR